MTPVSIASSYTAPTPRPFRDEIVGDVGRVLWVLMGTVGMVLLVGSGLMIRTFQALRRVDPGFTRPGELLTLRVTIPSAAVKEGTDVLRMQQAIADRIAAIPGVSSVGLTTVVPMDGQGWTDPIFADDKTYAEGVLPPLRRFKFIAPGLLRTMGNSVVAGRDFTWVDLYGRRCAANRASGCGLQASGSRLLDPGFWLQASGSGLKAQDSRLDVWGRPPGRPDTRARRLAPRGVWRANATPLPTLVQPQRRDTVLAARLGRAAWVSGRQGTDTAARAW